MSDTPISLFNSLGRGLASKCPNCGKGKLFRSYTKVNTHCPHCSEELFHHRADDMPAYIVITIVGHIIVPLILFTVQRYDIPDWMHMAIWIPLSVVLSLLLMHPVKGIVVALQWHIGLHGFAERKNKNKQ